MNLLLIARKIWHYKLLTLPVLALTLIGAFYMVAIRDPVYEASSSYILVNPPEPPTEEEIARDPTLGRGADNPYTRFSDQSVVVQVLTGRLSSDAARRDLVKRGADRSYTVAPSVEFGFTAPIVQITGTGSSPEAAVRTATVIGLAVSRELDRMQRARGVAANYRIDAQQVVAPNNAQLKASGQLRALVAVLALGGIVLFVVVSLADGLATLRLERSGREGQSVHADEDEFGWVPDERTDELAGLDLEDWSGLSPDSDQGGGIVDLFPETPPEVTPSRGPVARRTGSIERSVRRAGE